MFNLDSREDGNHHGIGGVKGCGILKHGLSNFVRGVIGAGCLILTQGFAYAAPPPESGSLPDGINLNSAQSVAGVVMVKTGDKPLPNGVNDGVELISPVAPEAKPMSAKSANYSDSQRVDDAARAKDKDKKILHYVYLTLYTVFVLFITMLVGLRGTGASLEEVGSFIFESVADVVFFIFDAVAFGWHRIIKRMGISISFMR